MCPIRRSAPWEKIRHPGQQPQRPGFRGRVSKAWPSRMESQHRVHCRSRLIREVDYVTPWAIRKRRVEPGFYFFMPCQNPFEQPRNP